MRRQGSPTFWKTFEQAPRLNICSHRDTCREDRVIGTRVDAALVLSLLKANISVVTPRWAPAVLHLPVVHSIVSAIPYQQDSVVGVGATAACDNSTSVVLEDSLIGLDGDGDGLLLKGRLQIGITAAGEKATTLIHTGDSAGLQANGAA